MPDEGPEQIKACPTDQSDPLSTAVYKNLDFFCLQAAAVLAAMAQAEPSSAAKSLQSLLDLLTSGIKQLASLTAPYGAKLPAPEPVTGWTQAPSKSSFNILVVSGDWRLVLVVLMYELSALNAGQYGVCTHSFACGSLCTCSWSCSLHWTPVDT